jgi:hypothetical protein
MTLTVTTFDCIEAAAIAALWLYAWGSPVKYAACSTIIGLASFHSVCRVYIGLYGPQQFTVATMSAFAGMIGVMHLFYSYTSRGLVTGIAFASVPIWAGLAFNGIIPIRFQSGPGFDFWTLTSVSAWVIFAVIFYSVREARNELDR